MTDLGRGVAVSDIGGDTGGEADVVEREVRDERVQLEEERERLADAACVRPQRVSHEPCRLSHSVARAYLLRRGRRRACSARPRSRTPSWRGWRCG